MAEVLSVRLNSQERFCPKQTFGLCSAHFNDSCFHVKGTALFNDCGKTNMPKRYLIRGSIPKKGYGRILYFSSDFISYTYTIVSALKTDVLVWVIFASNIDGFMDQLF